RQARHVHVADVSQLRCSRLTWTARPALRAFWHTAGHAGGEVRDERAPHFWLGWLSKPIPIERDIISRITRLQFREWLVDWTLREIDDLFTSYGFEQAYVPPEELPSGQRRSLVECFYEGVDWTDPGHIARILRIFEDVIFKVEDRS